MTHPADLLRKRLAQTRKKSDTGGNGKSKNEDILKTSTPPEKIETDNSLKDVKQVSAEEPKKAKPKAKPKKVSAKKPVVKKAVKKQKAKPKNKPKKVKAKPKKVKARPKNPKKPTRRKTKDTARTLDRDRKGDGLRPIEREIIEAVASSEGNLGILNIAHGMFGPKCGSEGPDSVRTVRNAIRIPIRYGIIEHSGRGHLCVTKAYTKNEGDLKSIVSSHKEQTKVA